MKMLLYPKLAFQSIKKNKRLYIPYMLAAAFVVMTFYLFVFLSHTNQFGNMRGGSLVGICMGLGTYVMIIFSMIFMIYTNSFLLKMRKKEWGLYNILGLSKGNVIKIVWWENVSVAVASLALGLGFGTLFSKLSELALSKLTGIPVDYSIAISVPTIAITTFYFLGIFLALFIFGLISVAKAKPTELLHGSQVGEKAPKANWFLGILGVVVMGIAYWIAVNIEDPIKALAWFFQAVIMVIIATYILFVAGSVVACKILQKNKNYYYKSSHFVSVSSMAYRMKRNGAGLATICILLTMILVMIASTSCLYKGAEDGFGTIYPRDISVYSTYGKYSTDYIESVGKMNAQVDEYLEANNLKVKNQMKMTRYFIDMVKGKDGIYYDKLDYNNPDFDYSVLCELVVMDIDDYNQIMGTDYSIGEGEALYNNSKYKLKKADYHLEVGPLSYRLVGSVDKIVDGDSVALDVTPTLYIIVNHLSEDMAVMADFMAHTGGDEMSVKSVYAFDWDNITPEEGQAYDYAIEAAYAGNENEELIYRGVSLLDRFESREEFYSVYGALFFVGIVLSFVFMVACILIIYYKQITEGYEDKSRFEIMQKVGMTKKDIKRSINSQMLLVFLLPILVAMLHLAFAFPMVFKLLTLFGLTNMPLFLLVSVLVAIIIAICYAIAYKLTTNVYLNIVSEAK